MTRRGGLVETAEAILVAAALALTFKGFVFQIFHVPSSSMEDTVLTGGLRPTPAAISSNAPSRCRATGSRSTRRFCA